MVIRFACDGGLLVSAVGLVGTDAPWVLAEFVGLGGAGW
jgi:hypothetical protein